MKDNHRVRVILLFLLFAAAITYLLLNTGIISDDFDGIAHLKAGNFGDLLTPKGVFYFIETPLQYYTHYIWYHFVSIDDAVTISIFKIAYVILSFYMIAQFFGIYVNKKDALLVSFLFIFFPSHDAATYWFMGQYLTLSIAFYLYAFYLAHRNMLLMAFLFALAASFISYGSPAVAVALSLLFSLNREFKKAFVLLVPNIIYSIYYIWLSKVAGVGVDKISGTLGIIPIGKQFIFQILTFIDATAGPSMWLKIYYSFSQLTIPSTIAAIALAAVLCAIYRAPCGKYNAKLIACLVMLSIASFFMFSITGKYPQMAFNLGNRVTIFGSLLLAYLIVARGFESRMKMVLLGILIFAMLGISDHWKDWNICQNQVIMKIKNNRSLREALKGNETIYVSGNQYSKYGPMSHIEFLSEGFVAAAVFKDVFGYWAPVDAINRSFRYAGGYLVDNRNGQKTKINGDMNVYDSEKDLLFKIKDQDISRYIDYLPVEYRHWIQLEQFKFVRNIALKFMPRLRYMVT